MNLLAFDIGCNTGEYTNNLIKDGYYVISVDANENLFKEKIKNCTRIFAACSDKIGTVTFNICNENGLSTCDEDWIHKSRFSKGGPVGKNNVWEPVQVSATTIDSLVEQFGIPKHIKIDVEGYEINCLKGMTKKYSEEICFEWAVEKYDSTVECVNYLNHLGYSKFGYIYCDKYGIKPNEFYDIHNFMKIFEQVKNYYLSWGMIWAI